MIGAVLLFTALGCGQCDIAKQDLIKACIPYKETRASSPNGINIRPMLQVGDTFFLGEVQIHTFTSSNNQCKK